MKISFYLSLVGYLLLSSLLFGQSETWVVRSTSNVHIYGTTNINSFHCACEDYRGRDTLSALCYNNTRSYSAGVIRLPSNGIDCGNAIMTADLQRTILADDFPYLQIRLIQLQGQLPGATSTNTGEVELEVKLAGRAKTIRLVCRLENKYATTWLLSGQHTFTFQDFALEPPQRLFGAVKVKQQLDVAFALELQMLPQD